MSFLETFILIISPIFGLVVGSFLNVVIFRTEKELTFGGRSFCPKCKKKLLWYDNIPLFSFLALGGKCRFCKKKISSQYPLVEAVTALVFLFSSYLIFHQILDNFLNHFFTISGILTAFSKNLLLNFSLVDLNFLVHFFELLFVVAILSTFLVIFIYDYKHLLIPDQYSIFGIILAFVFNLVADIFLFIGVLGKNNNGLISETFSLPLKKSFDSLPFNVSSLLGLPEETYQSKMIHLKAIFSSAESLVTGNSTSLIQGQDHPYISLFFASRTWSGLLATFLLAGFFFLIVYISKETWMGKGDIKLAIFMSLFLGTAKTLTAAMLAFEIGAVVGIAMIIFGRAKMKTALPFGPFLIIGTVLSLIIV